LYTSIYLYITGVDPPKEAVSQQVGCKAARNHSAYGRLLGNWLRHGGTPCRIRFLRTSGCR